MQAPAATTVVITDTNVLINFNHIDQVALLGELPAYRVGLPTEVLHELTDVSQRASIDAAIAAGKIHLLVTVAQADQYKAVLAVNRYTMPFASFAERL